MLKLKYLSKMERKIGEIFERAGEMIECVENKDGVCGPCFF